MPRQPSQPTLAQLLDGERSPRESFPDEEEITEPQNVGFDLELLTKYYLACANEDREYLLKSAERLAARNRKD